MLRFFSRIKPSSWRAGHRAVQARRFIFLYHRIASPPDDPFALAVPESWFQDHLEILTSHCRLVSLEEILVPTGGCPMLASITFDDGYADNLATASPILRSAGIPATFFICTGSLGDVRGFWWDRLARAIAGADTLPADREPIRNLSIAGDLNGRESRKRVTLELAFQLQRMRPDPRDRIVAELEDVLLAPPDRHRDPCPVLDEEGVRRLASQPLTELGAHTDRHPMLSILTRDEQLAEISKSVMTLERVTGTRPRFLAYPYGGERDYDGESCLAARDGGFQAAFVNHAARFDPPGQPHRVPRYYVPPLPADEFRTWLRGVLRG